MKKILLKTMLLLFALIAGSSSVWADEVYYTLTPASGSNNSYTGNCDVTISDITWNVEGNSTLQPWRLGGKSITDTDRSVYSKTAMGSAITKVELEVGTASSITVNSLKLIVASDAAFNTKIDEVTGAFAASSTIEFTPTSGTEWAKDAYYKFVFNVTVTGTSNKFVQFTSATFYKATAAGTTAAPSISGNTVFLTNTTVTITNDASADGADIYYTLNGEDPTTTTSATCFAYSAPFSIDATTTVMAIAKKSTDTNASSIVSETFTKVTPITVSAALTAITALDNNGTIADQCVSGIVCTAGSLNSGAITYYISADGTETNRLQVYKGKGLNNTAFEAAGDIAVGDEVVVYGTLKNYNGTTPEFDQGNYLLSKVRKPAPTFSLDKTSATLEAYNNETIDITLTTNTDGVITCESDNPDVATVALKSANVYTITAQTEGTATITISAAAGDTYNTASATVEVTVNDSRTEAGISFAEGAITKTWGEAYTGQALTNTHSLDVVYSSTDETVATVNSTGVVTVLKAGTTTIKATFTGNATYKAAIVSYELTVNKAEAGLSFDETEFNIELGDDSFVAPTLNNPNGLTVTYASNNETVALVDENTGELTYEESAEGTAIITATFAGNDNFKSGSASYTIYIYDPTVKGTKVNPYTVAEVIDGTATGTGIYVRGFIVGEYVGKTTNPRTSGFTTDANIAIADVFASSPTAAASIPVALPTDALKSAWGCKTNGTALLGYEVLIQGNKDTYFSVNGIKSTTEVTAVSIPVYIGSNGYATFASPYALDLTTANMPKDVTAYKAAVTGTTVNFSILNQTVPANTGILLAGDPITTYNIPVAASGDAVSENAFLVNTSGTTFDAEAGYTYFGMIKDSDPLTFGVFAPGTVAIPANKAYLKVATTSLVRELSTSFGETDGINTMDNGQWTIDNAVFDLSGRRVSKAVKGIYIVNGKKVVK